jgi:hypothetical protein
MKYLRRLSIQLFCWFLLSTGCSAVPVRQVVSSSCGLSEFLPHISRYKAGLEGLTLVTSWPDQTTTSTFISTTTLFQEIETFTAGQSEGVERSVQTDLYRYEEMEAIGGGVQVKVSLDKAVPLKTLDLFTQIVSGSCISESSVEGGRKYKIAREFQSKLPSRSGDEVGEMSVFYLPPNSPAPWRLGVSAISCRAADLVSGPQARLPVCSEGPPFEHN